MPSKKKAVKKAAAPHLRVRLGPQLLAKLEKSAMKAERTLTGEIAFRLDRSLNDGELEANKILGRIEALLLKLTEQRS